MVAISLPVGSEEVDRFVEAVQDFIALRRPLLTQRQNEEDV